MPSPDPTRESSDISWVKIVTKYNKPDHFRSWWQFASSLLLYSALWFLMYESLSLSYWLTLLLAFPAAGMLVRLFIIYHDCGHGSFFRSERVSDITGFFIGILTFTPYRHWTHNHRVHHETAGNLDKRGLGDVWTMTVDEYLSSTWWQKTVYRFYRHPVTLFLVGAPWVFIIGNRFPKSEMTSGGRRSVWLTNLGIGMYVLGLILLIGWKAFLMIQLPVITIAGIAGFWLFYIQHQFEETYWARGGEWDYKKVGLEGSSYYKLPRILHYFSGNIGYHHIHHLSPMIPNYRLARCHRENELFRGIRPLTIWQSFRTLTFRLWDERSNELISFRKLRKMRLQAVRAAG